MAGILGSFERFRASILPAPCELAAVLPMKAIRALVPPIRRFLRGDQSMRSAIVGLVMVLLAGCSSPAMAPIPAHDGAARGQLHPASLALTPFNAPTSVFPTATSTEPTGIRSNLITTTVTLQGGATVGGLYMMAQDRWLQVLYPDAASTAIYGPQSISGGYRVVGSYKMQAGGGDHGFVYDSVAKTFTTVDAPPKLCAPKKCNYTIA